MTTKGFQLSNGMMSNKVQNPLPPTLKRDETGLWYEIAGFYITGCEFDRKKIQGGVTNEKADPQIFQ